MYKLNIGEISENGQITILDEDKLCYRVKSNSKGATGIRTISKDLLNEFIVYVQEHPNASPNKARQYLSGSSCIDKFEYGYASTLVVMAKMALNHRHSADDSTSNTKTIQRIYFGSPGTGKSHYVKNNVLRGVPENLIFRTTFHPDSDYASFVGTYKPTSTKIQHKSMDYNEIKKTYYDICGSTQRPFHKFVAEHYEDLEKIDRATRKQMFLENGVTESIFEAEYPKVVSIAKHLDNTNANKSTISYQFEPQVFTEAYIKAWQNPDKNVYLIIEEINRGNCAQIFGDLFQLLDREKGISEYPVKAEASLAQYLARMLTGKADEGIKDGKLKLPANLNIIATMNTSDQSLFPMDSAFKRRWEWKYIPTTPPTGLEKKLNIHFSENTDAMDGTTIEAGNYAYNWSEFLLKINENIRKATHSDDKQLGFWFVKADKSNNISITTFVSKVIFYLWNDVFKDFGPKDINPFATNINGKNELMTFNAFFEINSQGQIVENIGVLHTFMNNLGLIPNYDLGQNQNE